MRPAPLTREQVRRVDAIAIERYGMPGTLLMENAGRGTADLLLALDADRVAICCGRGNNGGDGFVIARRLAASGRSVLCVLAADASKLSGGTAAGHNWMVLQAMASSGSLELFVAPTPELLLRLRERIAEPSRSIPPREHLTAFTVVGRESTAI